MTQSPLDHTKVFISYSHKDSRYLLEELQAQLGYLERLGRLEFWDDTKITPGLIWQQEIKRAIQSARVAILLISANFLNSEFIVNNELPPLLKAAKYEGVTILPVIVGACNFEYTDLKQFQVVNDPSKPLNKMRKPEREQAWANIAKVVLEALSTQKSESAEDLVIYGKKLNVQGNYREAATVLHQAWLMKPDSFDTWLEYGYALDKLGHHNEAFKAFEHAILLDPYRFIASSNSSKGRSILSNSKHVSIFSGSGSGTYNHGLGTVPSEIILMGTNGSKGISYDNVGSNSVHIINSTAQVFLGLAIERSLSH